MGRETCYVITASAQILTKSIASVIDCQSLISRWLPLLLGEVV
jgi:hypothetical protein